MTLCRISLMSKIILYLILKRKRSARKVKGEKKIKIYLKEVINPNLEVQKYLSVLTRSKKKINISKIRTNSYEILVKEGIG